MKDRKNINKNKNKQQAYTHAAVMDKIPVRSFSEFFSLYYSNMPKILLCNLLFSIPVMVISVGMYFLINAAQTFGMYILTILGGVFLIYIFYAGVNAVTISIMDKKKNFSVFKTFFIGIVKYLPKFILHSITVSLCFLIAYFSYTFYSALASQSALFLLFYVFYFVFVYLMIFVISHLPLLTLKFEAGLGEIYRTSFVMITKNAANNLLISAIITMLAILSYIFISMSWGIWYLTLILAFALLLVFPALISLMSNFFLYDRTRAYLYPKENDKNSQPGRQDVPPRSYVSGVNIPQSEYVFYNGKMIKKEQLEKELAAQEGKED